MNRILEQFKHGITTDGYRDTEAGVLPSDWECAKISEIFDPITQVAGTDQYETVSISAGVGFVNQAQKFGKELSGKQYEKYTVLHRGDFSYNKGNSGKYPQGCIYRLKDRESAAVPNVFESFCIKSGCSDYYDQLFTSGYLNHQLYRLINHGVRDDGLLNLTQEDFYSCTLPVPPYSEQEKIAEILATQDSVVELCEKNIEQLKKLKKVFLQKMFPKPGATIPEWRFPGFTDAWEQRKFASVFDGLQNNTLSRAELNYESGTVKNVHYGDVLIKFGDYIDASETELPYISDDAKADKFKNSFLQDGDIIIADTAEDDTVGKCTEIQGSEGLKLLSGLHTIACRPKEKYGPMFLGYYINSPAYHNQLKPLMQGIKVTSISKSAFQDTDMIVPKSIDEQIKIGEYFANLDNLITLHQRKCDEEKHRKNALMQLLLTGIVRLKI